MSVTALVRARDRLLAAVRDDASEAELLPEVVAALHDVALFHWCALVRTDPETMLPSTAAVEGFEEHMCVPFWDNELLDPDFVKFNELARSHDPVATLHEATDGDLARSPRYRELYRDLAPDDELRVAFTSGTTCWAVAALIRPGGAGPYPASEVDAVRELAPVATRALRTAATKADHARAAAGPAMLVVDRDGAIESMTAGAEAVLLDLRTHGMRESVPTAVLAAARRAKSSRSSARIAVRAQGASGRWMKLHASPLGDDGRVAVMIELASATDLVPILLESYGLTERETEVVFLLARGLSSKDIAAELCISPHTVNDHIKVIFTKVGVSSRGELVARLFANHLLEQYHDSQIRVAST